MTEWKEDFNNQEFIDKLKNLKSNIDVVIQDLKTQREELKKREQDGNMGK
tara:strand:+ start:1041 stop:1190 length:150 start_codon:yes stop_codon:yes gene_type:complete